MEEDGVGRDGFGIELGVEDTQSRFRIKELHPCFLLQYFHVSPSLSVHY